MVLKFLFRVLLKLDHLRLFDTEFLIPGLRLIFVSDVVKYCRLCLNRQVLPCKGTIRPIQRLGLPHKVLGKIRC